MTPGVIWVGTDDGKVQVTRDHGATWTDMTAAIASVGGPADRYVSRVLASPHDAGAAFVAKSGFRNDDFRPFLYRTTDFGRRWTSIGRGLPDAPINVVFQDRKNKDLLFVGNDAGVWVSIDAGVTWTQLKANLPTVAVHDLTVHPRENDLVLGPYGRGIFVGDVSHLQEVTSELAERALHVFEIEPRTRYQFRALGNYHLFGDAFLEVPNEPDALSINYYVRDTSDGGAQVVIDDVSDVSGQPVATLRGTATRGLNRMLWNMRRAAPGGGRGGGGAALLPTEDYRATVTVGAEQQTRIGRIRDRIR